MGNETKAMSDTPQLTPRVNEKLSSFVPAGGSPGIWAVSEVASNWYFLQIVELARTLERELAALLARSVEMPPYPHTFEFYDAGVGYMVVRARDYDLLRDRHEAGLARVGELEAELLNFSKYIYLELDMPDHACAQCVPHSDLLIKGFVCVKHRAIARIAEEELRRADNSQFGEGA